MKLSANFNLAEFTRTATGKPNTPDALQIANLKRMATDVCQPLRDALGMAIRINSGFRSPAVNKAVGGSRTSAHMAGLAVDLACADLQALFEKAIKLPVFDQVIWVDTANGGFIHIGLRPLGTHHRRQILRKAKGRIVAIWQNGKWGGINTHTITPRENE